MTCSYKNHREIEWNFNDSNLLLIFNEKYWCVRISNIDKKLNNVSLHLNSLELEFETKCHEVDKKKISKAEAASIEELRERIVFLETFKLNYENAKVTQKSCDKRLNILVQGLKEDSDNAWEKRDRTIEKYEEFLQNGLKIVDPNDVKQRWNRSGFFRLESTGKFQNVRRLTGFWPARSTGFLKKVFVPCSMYLIKNFQKGVGHRWDVKICDFERGLRKKRKKIFTFFAKITQF